MPWLTTDGLPPPPPPTSFPFAPLRTGSDFISSSSPPPVPPSPSTCSEVPTLAVCCPPLLRRQCWCWWCCRRLWIGLSHNALFGPEPPQPLLEPWLCPLPPPLLPPPLPLGFTFLRRLLLKDKRHGHGWVLLPGVHFYRLSSELIPRDVVFSRFWGRGQNNSVRYTITIAL